MSNICPKCVQKILKIDLRGVRMGPYGSVWVRMVPGDLFQGFPGPKPLKNIEKTRALGVRGGGSPLILTYMALRPAYGLSEDPGLTTCFFPGRDGVGGRG